MRCDRDARSIKAQNHLSYAMNQQIKNQGLHAKKGGYINGTIDTIPNFSSWFITGSRNSIYPFSMVGQSPSAGGTTSVNNQIIPLVSVLLVGGAQLPRSIQPWPPICRAPRACPRSPTTPAYFPSRRCMTRPRPTPALPRRPVR